jgi:hypothetical protein
VCGWPVPYFPEAAGAVLQRDDNFRGIVGIDGLGHRAQCVAGTRAVWEPEGDGRQQVVWREFVVDKRDFTAPRLPIAHLTHLHGPGDACPQVCQDEWPQDVVVS